jgi:glycosyltransferase involved in cell wall biosynthesis
MDRTRFDNEVCFLCGEGPATSILSSLGIKTYHLNYGKKSILSVLFALYKILKRGDYDILHIYGLKANLIGRVVGRVARCRRIVAGLRNIYPGDKECSKLHFMLDKLTIPLIDLYISNSKSAADFVVSKGYPRKKLIVVHNGINPERFHIDREQRLIKELGLKEESPVIITVANMRPQKAYRVLIDSLNLLIQRKSPFSALFVGDGILKDELMKLTEDLGLSERINFLGDRRDVPALLSISDIFVLPSYWEGLPVSIMEAMCAKLPVVATDVGGVSELVEDGVTGFLVPPKNPEALAEKIERLLADKDLRKEMGMAGYERIKKGFSLEKTVKEMERIYTELANL